jgi:hypothetical protein
MVSEMFWEPNSSSQSKKTQRLGYFVPGGSFIVSPASVTKAFIDGAKNQGSPDHLTRQCIGKVAGTSQKG